MSRRYLRKNEVKYNTNPMVQREDGKGHFAYVSAKQGKKKRVNILTHSYTFFGLPTIEMKQNPNRSKYDTRKSRFSVPYWEDERYLRDTFDVWKVHKQDRKKINKYNKNFFNKGIWK